MRGERVVTLPEPLGSRFAPVVFPDLGRPTIIANFVSTIDGVVSLGIPGQAGGEPISGGNEYDRLQMALLRAIADAVVVGAGTVAVGAGSPLTAEQIAPEHAEAFQELRQSFGLAPRPLQVIVTGRGTLNADRALFREPDLPVLLVTTAAGKRRLAGQSLPASVAITTARPDSDGAIQPAAILRAIKRRITARIILIEAGPTLVGAFFAERALDELFLTIAPQIAGRDRDGSRPSLAGRALAPAIPTWADLIDLRQDGSHLFLRYRFRPR